MTMLPSLSGPLGAALLLGLKILGAVSFVTAADLVMLYAC
jgi:hypothetical protein